ncbi:MAG: MFS transporter [Myxococcota bacterium]
MNLQEPEEAKTVAAPPRSRGIGRATESLEIPAFRRVFTSNMAFFLAMGGQMIVRPWIVFELTDSAFKLAVVSAATAVPMLLLSPFGGALSDRMERRRVILLAQSLAVFAEMMPLVLLHLGRLEYWHMLATSALMGCVFPLIMPARSAIIASLVGKRGLSSAMALNMTGVNVTRVVGPALAGAAIPIIGIERVYLADLVLYGLALVALLRIPKLPPPAGAHHESIGRNMLDGFRYLGRNRLVLILLLYGLVPQFLAMPFQNLLPVFAKNVWNMGEFGFGILSASAGMGAVTGSALVAARRPDAGRLSTMMFSVIAFGTLLAGFAASPWFWVAVPLVFLANIFASTFTTLNNVAIQLVIPDSVRGRISAFLMMSVSLPLLGVLPIGALAEKLGAPIAVTGASLMASIAAVVFYVASRNLRELDEHVHRSSKEE